jgi:DNA-binding response OmpR family regulator
MALSSRYDAVLMDINMPVKDGLQALAEIRRKAGPSAPPVIALTADALADDRERFLAAGMIACVTKPIDEADLLQTLDRVLGRPGIVADRTGATTSARDAGRSTLTDGQRRAVLDLVSALDDEPEADA